MVTFDGTCQTDTSGTFTNLDPIMLNSLKTKEPPMYTKVVAASAPKMKTLATSPHSWIPITSHEQWKYFFFIKMYDVVF